MKYSSFISGYYTKVDCVHAVRFGKIERAHGHFLIFFQNYFSHFKPATGYAVQVHNLVMYQLNRHCL